MKRSGTVRPMKPRRITPADEELSDELLHIFHNPTQGWWSNRWVVDLEEHRDETRHNKFERPPT